MSSDEFHRAVKICTGTSLSPHLVHTVFSIFDEDGDGLLSYREFIAIMKDRLHRGFKVSNVNVILSVTLLLNAFRFSRMQRTKVGTHLNCVSNKK